MYSEVAQRIIHKIISTVKESDGSQIGGVIQEALRDLVVELKVDQGLIWLVIGTQLMVKASHSERNPSKDLLELTLSTESSALISLNFLTSDSASIIIGEEPGGDWGPLLAATKDFKSQLVTPLKARGLLPGFIMLQSIKEFNWTAEQRDTLEQVASLLSVIISYDYTIQK